MTEESLEKTKKNDSTSPPRKRFKSLNKNDIFSIIPKPDSIKLVKEDVFQPFHRPKTPIYIVNTKKEVRCSTPNPKPKKRIRNLTKDSKDLNENEIIVTDHSKESSKNYHLNKLVLQGFLSLKQPGLFQKPLSPSNSKENILNDKESLFSIRKEILLLQQDISEKLNDEINKTSEIQPKPLTTKNITEQNLKFILNEFDKPCYQRNYQSIDKIFASFEFFKRYNLNLRIKIFEIASISNFLAEQPIFFQGDKGDKLYVIIKGSVSIIKKSEDFSGNSIVVNSLYDRTHFGDLGLINALQANPLTERSATCIANERSYFLSIPKLEYQKILLELELSSIEAKTIFLSQISFFKEFDSALLVPLACGIEKKTFFLNEVILNKGEKPIGLYLIFSGSVDLFTSSYVVREKFGSEYANVKIRKPKPELFVGPNFSGVRIKN